jgi:hypothetical protein
MRLVDVGGPILRGVVKKDVTLKVLGQHCIFTKGMGLKFCKEQVPQTDSGKNSVRILRPKRMFPFEYSVGAFGMKFLVMLNQEFLCGLVKQVYLRVDDRHKEPTNITYTLTETVFGFKIDMTSDFLEELMLRPSLSKSEAVLLLNDM